MVTTSLSPKILITGIILLSLLLIKDLKTKIIISNNTMYHEKLMTKKAFPIDHIARIFKGKSSNVYGYSIEFYVQDKKWDDVFVFPESLPQKEDLHDFKNIIKTINPDIDMELEKPEVKLF